jgi:hypothetical protein
VKNNSDKEDLLAVYQNNNTEGQSLMDHFSYLKHYPMNVFYSSNTPIGLYARQKWLYQEDSLAWKNDFRETADSLFA